MPDKPNLDYEKRAAEMWATFDSNERAGVRFGIFPAQKMERAEGEGYQSHPLVVALMRHATKR